MVCRVSCEKSTIYGCSVLTLQAEGRRFESVNSHTISYLIFNRVAYFFVSIRGAPMLHIACASRALVLMQASAHARQPRELRSTHHAPLHPIPCMLPMAHLLHAVEPI